jgi:hypothetical protein
MEFPFAPDIEQDMKTFFGSLREKDRRRYAAIEARKLGHGGITYIATLLAIDPKTIQHGLRELTDLPDIPLQRCRRPGGGPKRR